MAKSSSQTTAGSFDKILAEIKSGRFRQFYILAGDEPYYSDVISKEIMERALTPEERGFNQLLLYGNETDTRQIVEAARRYPMMSARQLVVVREAQFLKNLELLETYVLQPLPSTILILSFTGKTLDKRTRFYKSAVAAKDGFMLESSALREWEIAGWIGSYLSGKGYSIEEKASAMLAEFSGTELRKLVVQLDKILVNSDEGKKLVTAEDVERNVGISREYNVFELTNALSFKNSEKAFKIVFHFALNDKQYPIIMTLAAIFSHFTKILKFHALKAAGNGRVNEGDAMSAGIYRFAFAEYDTASKNYPLRKCMAAMALIRKYDRMGKSNDRGEATDGELLQELVFKIMN
ncbi:MAG: DNA polymerase III subunit delta [Bacteroidetes bacterium HGW-Bacteroidetes-10]|jgi:DNA polymerase-3 subunit delta|nr:MAG: DNA polymerase III subunit delta [Bacteroidetes bacterium HGW-Bacteroidetes-10]